MAGFLDRLFGGNNENRNKSSSMHPGDPALVSLFGDQNGNNVTSETAMRSTAVWACVSLLQETIAAFPIHVLKKDDKKKPSKAKNHPLYKILAHSPYSGITSFEYREMMVGAICLKGDFYARILLNGKGEITGLEPIPKFHITPKRKPNGEVYFVWNKGGIGAAKILLDNEVLRIPYKMLDGLNSLSPIETHRRTIGNSLRSSQFQENFYKNAAVPHGAIVSKNTVGVDAANEIRKSWEKRHKGPENFGKVAILDGGMEWQQFGMSMQDAQYIEMNNFEISDIARIFLMPPHKIGDLSRATFSNIESQNISFVVDVILSWVKRIETRFNLYLLSEQDRKAGYYIAFDLKGLLRGDSAARVNFYRTMFYISAMNPNEIRAAEDMSPIDNGENYFVQGATVPTDKLFDDPLESIDPALVEKINEIIDVKLRKTPKESK